MWPNSLGTINTNILENNNALLGINNYYQSLGNIMNTQADLAKLQLKAYNDYLNSWQYKYLDPAMKGLSGLTSLANLYMGFKQYGLAKRQVSIAEDQWDTTKKEMDRIANVRDRITNKFVQG